MLFERWEDLVMTRGISVLKGFLKKQKDFDFIVDMAELSLSKLQRLYSHLSQ